MAKELVGGRVKEATVTVKEADYVEQETLSVKEEPKWETEGDATALAELYADHVVKEELVLGPELLQQKDVGFSTYCTFYTSQREVSTCKQHSCPVFNHHGDKVSLGTSLVKLERNHVDIKLHECDINQKTFDDNFSFSTDVNTRAEEANLTDNNNYESVSKTPYHSEEKKPKPFLPNFSNEVYSTDFGQKILDSKINLTTAAEGKIDTKEHTKQKIILAKHFAKENNPLFANQFELDVNKNSRYKVNTSPVESETDDLKTCEVCKKTFVSQVNLLRHKRLHTGQKPYACKICKKEFVRKDYLNRHEMIHSKQKPFKFKCEYCPKLFAHKSNFTRHTRYHTGQKLYICEVCGNQFGQKIHLATHQLTHTGQKPYSCEICLKGFTYKHRLTAHKRIHAGVKPFRCQICPKRFIAKCRLTRHEILIHAARLLFVCDVCETQFETKKEIIKHLTNLHSNKPAQT